MKNIEKHESIRFENQAGVYIGYAVELSNLLETAEESQVWEIETAIRTLIYLADHNLQINGQNKRTKQFNKSVSSNNGM